MSPALRAVEQIYFQYQQNLDMMLGACKTDVDRRTISMRLVEARVNYYACINKAFHDDDPALEDLVEEANVSVGVIMHIEQELGDISKVIADVTKAVTVGAQIAAKVIAV